MEEAARLEQFPVPLLLGTEEVTEGREEEASMLSRYVFANHQNQSVSPSHLSLYFFNSLSHLLNLILSCQSSIQSFNSHTILQLGTNLRHYCIRFLGNLTHEIAHIARCCCRIGSRMGMSRRYMDHLKSTTTVRHFSNGVHATYYVHNTVNTNYYIVHTTQQLLLYNV